MGLASGTIFPALSSLLASWVPVKERGKLGSFVLGGSEVRNNFTNHTVEVYITPSQFQFGAIVGNFISGLLLHHLTWHWVFYCFGALAVVWCIFFVSKSIRSE